MFTSIIIVSDCSLAGLHGLPMSVIQVPTCLVSAFSYCCVVTHNGVQEAGEADTASMDEEQAAQEEVERLDSGTAFYLSHGFASLLLIYVGVALHVGAGLSSLPVRFDCCTEADVQHCKES